MSRSCSLLGGPGDAVKPEHLQTGYAAGLLQNEISGKESQGSLQGGQDFSFYSSYRCAMAVSQARLRDSMKRTY